MKQPENVDIPNGWTVYRVMEMIGISHLPGRKTRGITKADKETRKSDDHVKPDFYEEEPLVKCVTFTLEDDIIEIKKIATKRCAVYVRMDA